MIDANVPGPWAVDNSYSVWVIINKKTGQKKVIGRVYRPRSRSKVNYFDRAMEEANRRNTALLEKTR